jgi:nitrogenase molybdenum-iron protein beta chain
LIHTALRKPDFVRYAEALFSKFASRGAGANDAGDLFELHQWIKNDPVTFYKAFSRQTIARRKTIPLVRAGFPLIDR